MSRPFVIAVVILVVALVGGLYAVTTVPGTGDLGGNAIGPVAKAAPSGEQFGANVGTLFNSRRFGPGQINSQLAALHWTGATLARSDALWERTEPRPPTGNLHSFDWSFDDLVAASLAEHGLRWLPILDYTAGWARLYPHQLHSPPSSPTYYAEFAAAFASRYGQGGWFWREHPTLIPLPVETYEIWNEPDQSSFWYPRPNPAAYDQLYLAARDAITAVQPTARVIVGGLTAPTRFLTAMLRARPAIASQLDGVGIHPYGPNPSYIIRAVRRTRQSLDSLRLARVPLYVTEFGWTTRPRHGRDYAPQRLRPSYISSTITALGRTGCGVAAALIYAWVTLERNPANRQDWYGIHPTMGGTSSDTTAFTEAVHRAAAAGPARACG
jgi:hypothetical protein